MEKVNMQHFSDNSPTYGDEKAPRFYTDSTFVSQRWKSNKEWL